MYPPYPSILSEPTSARAARAFGATGGCAWKEWAGLVLSPSSQHFWGHWDITGTAPLSYVLLSHARLQDAAEQMRAQAGRIELLPRVGEPDPLGAYIARMLGRLAARPDRVESAIVEQALDLLCFQGPFVAGPLASRDSTARAPAMASPSSYQLCAIGWTRIYQVSVLACDVTDDRAVNSLVSTVLSRTGRIDVLGGGGGADPVLSAGGARTAALPGASTQIFGRSWSTAQV